MLLMIFSLSFLLNYTVSLYESRIHITEILWITFLSYLSLLELGAVVIKMKMIVVLSLRISVSLER